MGVARLFAHVGKIVLLIEEKPDGWSLFEFRPDGFIGDTWHFTLDDAKAQAIHFWGDQVSEWQPVPVDVADAVEFARQNSN